MMRILRTRLASWMLGCALLAALNANASTLNQRWPGMNHDDSPKLVPPDPHGAAGPQGIIAAVNGRICYYTRQGSFTWGPTNMATFFGPNGTTGEGMCDPKAMFDPDTQRFFVIAQETSDTNKPNHSYLNVAVSRNAHPTSPGTNDWFFYRHEMTQTQLGIDFWGDYPGVGFDSRAFYVTYNMFPFSMRTNSGPNPQGWERVGDHGRLFVLKKSDLIQGTLTIHGMDVPTGYTLQPATVTGSATPGNKAYFVQLDSPTTARIWVLDDPLGARQMFPYEVPVPLTGTPLLGAPQSGTDTRLDTITPLKAQGSAYWNDGSLWFCYTGANPAARARVWYYEIRTREFGLDLPLPLLKRSGMIGDEYLLEAWTFQPALAVNQRGDVCIVYCQSSGYGSPAIMWTTIPHDYTPFDLFEPPRYLMGSSSSYDGTLKEGKARWGDYAVVAVDPTDDSFWICHEYSRSSTFNDWGTYWGHITVPQHTIYVDINNPCGLPQDVIDFMHKLNVDEPWLLSKELLDPFNWGSHTSTPQSFSFHVGGDRLCAPAGAGKIWNPDAGKWQYLIPRGDGSSVWSDDFCIDLPGWDFTSSLFCLGGPYRTLTEGVLKASHGDALVIGNGNYNEPMTINKRLTLQSEGGSAFLGKR